MESKGYILKDKEQVEERKSQLEREISGIPNLGYTRFMLNIIEEATPVVLRVRASSPAALAGMRANDIVVERDGKVVSTVGELRAMPKLKIGDWVEYKVLRGSEELVF